MKGSGHDLVWDTIPKFPWTDWGRPWKASVIIPDVLNGMRTWHCSTEHKWGAKLL